jgi:hypothetical protein
MHVTAVLDAIQKCGHFHDYKKAEKAYDEAEKAIESARAGLALIDGTGARSRRFRKKKAKKATKKALAKAQDSKSEAQEAKEATKVNNKTMKAGFQVGGPLLKSSKKKFAPNVIFRVVSCLYILYDLTYSFLWKNSTHSLSYKV